MKTRLELKAAVERVRRGSRNVDLLDICDEVERLWPIEDEVRAAWREARRAGRPLLGGKRLTNAERCRRYRERRKAERAREGGQ